MLRAIKRDKMFSLSDYSAIKYRNDIQGIRALGALIIMVFHVWMNKVSGGVDIFIVVSGYLITSVFIKNLVRKGRLGVPSFIINILTRITPSAFLILVVSLVAGWLVLPLSEQQTIFKEFAASFLHLENIQLIRKSVNYLENTQQVSPVQQFWALSLQVQIYFFLAVILLPVFLYSVNKSNLKLIFYVYIFLAVVSFGYAHYSVQFDQARAYFNTFARLWEFLLGGIVYLIQPYIRIKERVNGILACLGFSLVFVSAFFLPVGAPYPAYPALVPVSAALLLIITGERNNLVGRLLSIKPLVFIGSFSFLIYLWHWPVLTYYKYYAMKSYVGFYEGLVVVFISIGLSYFTFKFWETPIISLIARLKNKAKVFVIFLFVLIGVFFSIVFLLLSQRVVTQEVSNVTRYHKLRHVFIGSVSSDSLVAISDTELLVAKKIIPLAYSNSSCHQTSSKSTVLTCTRVVGSENSKKVLVVGSSHILQWLPALESIAEKNNLQLQVMSKSGCPVGKADDLSDSCNEWNSLLFNEINNNLPDVIITNSTRTFVDKPELVSNGFVKFLKKMKKLDIPVVGIRDNPRFSYEPQYCLLKAKREGGKALDCSINREIVYPVKDPALKHFDLVRSIDLSDKHCDSLRCYSGGNEALIYRDSNHLHVPYVESLILDLEEKLLSAMRDINE